MPLPDSNLPASSLPWGREVEKQLETLKDSVYVSNINNSARDATSQTSINNLLDLMADQVELVTYSTELDPSKPQSVTFTSFLSEFTSKTNALDINIILNKPRKLLINYSTYYTVILTTSATGTDVSSYGFEAKIFVDGIAVDSQYIVKSNSKNVANNFVYDFDSINLTKLLAVPAGPHKISVSMKYTGTPTTGGNLVMDTAGDNLIVTVVQ